MSEFAVTQNISSRRIADLFVSAIEGGSNYWCSGVFLLDPKPDRGEALTDRAPWYDRAELYDDPNFTIGVCEHAETTTNIVTKANIAAGLRLLAEKWPGHFADVLAENDDATTADVFLQLVALGEVRYG